MEEGKWIQVGRLDQLVCLCVYSLLACTRLRCLWRLYNVGTWPLFRFISALSQFISALSRLYLSMEIRLSPPHFALSHGYLTAISRLSHGYLTAISRLSPAAPPPSGWLRDRRARRSSAGGLLEGTGVLAPQKGHTNSLISLDDHSHPLFSWKELFHLAKRAANKVPSAR